MHGGWKAAIIPDGAAMEYRLRILHLSDLHVAVALDGMDAERKAKVAVRAAGHGRVIEESNFLEVLSTTCEQAPIDLVCMTGDVADWGLAEEYARTTAFVDRVLDAVRVPRDRLFLVPGNHDVRRRQRHDAWRELRKLAAANRNGLSDWMGGMAAPYGADASWPGLAAERTAAFWNWVRGDLGRKDLRPSSGRLGYRSTLEGIAPFPVHVIGLDSAWLCGDDDDAGKLLLTASQIGLLTREESRRLPGFRLALVHHPLSALADERESFDLLAESTDLLLHGHQHDPQAGVRTDPDKRLHVLAAGALYEGDERDRWPNSFHVIDAFVDDRGQPRRYRVSFWSWARRGFWHRASELYRNAPDGLLEVEVPPGARPNRNEVPVPAPKGRTAAPRTRVCFVSSEYPPCMVGGLGVHVEQLTTALSEHVDVDVVLPPPAPPHVQYERPSRQQVHLQPLAGGNPPSYNRPTSWLRFAQDAAEKIGRMPAASRPRVLHCHDWVTVLAGIKCRWLLQIPLVFHLHLPNRTPLCASIENLGLICADLVTVNSEAMREELKHRNLPIRRVEVVANAVDTDLFRPCDDWPAADPYVLFVGRLVEQKGLEYLLRAFRYTREKFPDVGLKLVGSGDLEVWLDRLRINLMLTEKEVEFLDEWRPQKDLVSFYQKARVVVVPSIYEPFGMIALEAAACQRPVVASRVGGLVETVEHGVTGFLAEPKDDLDLAQWLMRSLSNADLSHSMGQTGRTRLFERGYTWPRVAERFVELYDVVGKSPPDRTFSEDAGTHAGMYCQQISRVGSEDHGLWPALNEYFNRDLSGAQLHQGWLRSES